MRSPEKQQREHATELAATGGLLGVSVLAILQLVQIPVLSSWLDFAIFAVAVATPLLAAGVLLLMGKHVDADAEPLKGIRSLPGPLGGLVLVAGLGACIAHHHLVAGILFWAVGVGGFSLSARISVRIERSSDESEA